MNLKWNNGDITGLEEGIGSRYDIIIILMI